MTSPFTKKCWEMASVYIFFILVTVLNPVSAKDDSLYKSLGENPGIEKLTDAILERIYNDERIAFLFEDTDRANLQGLLVEQFCELSGGPCTYSGLSMLEVHSGLDIKHKEFDIFVEDSILGMTDADVPHRFQNQLLALLAPMRPEVILQ